MNYWKRIAIIVVAFLLYSCETNESCDRVIIKGTVRRVGNEPFTSLVITDADHTDWYVDNVIVGDIQMLEKREIMVEGTPSTEKRTLANGERTEDKHVLSDIVIIGVYAY